MTTTIKDASGREFVAVPVDATQPMLDAMFNARSDGGALRAALAAAPEYVAPVVTDEVAREVHERWERPFPMGATKSGHCMIAAVQQVLGPLFGLVPREWVEDAYREASEYWSTSDYETDRAWPKSDACKRLEGNGNG